MSAGFMALAQRKRQITARITQSTAVAIGECILISNKTNVNTIELFHNCACGLLTDVVHSAHAWRAAAAPIVAQF